MALMTQCIFTNATATSTTYKKFLEFVKCSQILLKYKKVLFAKKYQLKKVLLKKFVLIDLIFEIYFSVQQVTFEKKSALCKKVPFTRKYILQKKHINGFQF